MPEPLEIGLTVEEIELSKMTIEEPTMDLKYINDVLHQKWIKKHLKNGSTYVMNVEEIWKPIPREY